MNTFLTLSLQMALASPEEDKDEKSPSPIEFSDFDVSGDMLGATPGGAQDITFFRDRVAADEIPLPEVFTAEGLFSEHDLPLLASAPCHQLLCTNVAAAPADLVAQPDVRWLVQVGFASGLSAETFRRPPLNLVAVVDKSGSMSGTPIETVQHALHAIIRELGPDDQLSIVLYGDEVHTHLEPTKATEHSKLDAAVDAIAIDGSTNLEAGLLKGFALARESRRTFDGTTRVMLFTDERPNTGRTDADAFMTLSEAASRDGIGMTTVGVGVQFGAELAQKVSSVRGGNLLFFSDTEKMRNTFAEEFDYLVTELGYDLDMIVHPASGQRITGVYGIPGDKVQWTGDGGIQLHVSTLFLSKREGAIYLSLANTGGPRSGKQLGSVSLSYEPRDGVPTASETAIYPTEKLRAAGNEGLSRGVLLVDELTVLKKATALHHESNDQEGAWQLVSALSARLAASDDPELASEIELVAHLEEILGKLAGRTSERTLTQSIDPVSGLPRR